MTQKKLTDKEWWRKELIRKWERGVIPPRVIVPGDRPRNTPIPALNQMSYEDYLATPYWRLMKKHFFMFAWTSGVCAECDTPSYILEVHHKDFRSLGRDGYDNLIALCPRCANRKRNRERERELEIIAGIAAATADELRRVSADAALEVGQTESLEAGAVSLSGLQRQGEDAGDQARSDSPDAAHDQATALRQA